MGALHLPSPAKSRKSVALSSAERRGFGAAKREAKRLPLRRALLRRDEQQQVCRKIHHPRRLKDHQHREPAELNDLCTAQNKRNQTFGTATQCFLDTQQLADGIRRQKALRVSVIVKPALAGGAIQRGIIKRQCSHQWAAAYLHRHVHHRSAQVFDP